MGCGGLRWAAVGCGGLRWPPRAGRDGLSQMTEPAATQSRFTASERARGVDVFRLEAGVPPRRGPGLDGGCFRVVSSRDGPRDSRAEPINTAQLTLTPRQRVPPPPPGDNAVPRGMKVFLRHAGGQRCGKFKAEDILYSHRGMAVGSSRVRELSRLACGKL